jgi:hypothetical protein
MNPRLLRPRATGFNPRSIAGLNAWWDFSDSAQITLNSGNISQILDKSGSGRTASQGTAANQPEWTSNAQAGRSMVTFNGSSRFLTYATDLFTFTGAATVFVVCRDVTIENGDYAAFLLESRSTRTSVMLAPSLFDANQRGFRPGLDSWSGPTYDTSSNFGSPTQTSPAIVQYYWENWSTAHNDGKTQIGVNNDSESLTSRGSSPLTFSTAATLRDIGAGRGPAPSIANSFSVLNGKVGEILVWTVALSAGQREAVRRYLGSKWGIATT